MWRFLGFFLLHSATVLWAQIPDSLQALPDSVKVETDSLEAISVLAFPSSIEGNIITQKPLVKEHIWEISPILARVPNAFVYDMGSLGWHNGIAFYGLSPNLTQLSLEDISFNSLILGRPFTELLPLEFLDKVSVSTSNLNHPVTVQTSLRDFDEAKPYTELRYRGGDNGLQFISAIHQQTRQKRWFQQVGKVQYLFGVAGRKATGEYPNSSVEAQQVLTRVRYQNAHTSLEVTNLYNRSKNGVHGGVEAVPANDFNSIYDRRIQQVANVLDKRTTTRNDMFATLQSQLFKTEKPLRATVHWNHERFKYQRLDTLHLKANRFGTKITQPFSFGNHRITVKASGWIDQLIGENVTTNVTDVQAHLTVSDSLLLRNGYIYGQSGYHLLHDTSQPSGVIEGQFGTKIQGKVGLRYGQLPRAWAFRENLGNLITGVKGIALPTWINGMVGIQSNQESVVLSLEGFASQIQHPALLVATSSNDTTAVTTDAEVLKIFGLTGMLRWRMNRAKGVWARVLASTYYFPDGDAFLQERREKVLPALFMEGFFGIKQSFFKSDLEVNVYLRGRFWSAFRSLAFQASTGLWSLPNTTGTETDRGGTLDVYATADIRGARLFVAYENVLFGLLYPGNLMVSTYPLPAQQFRFGVFWPIWN